MSDSDEAAPEDLPEILVDFNARVTKRGHMLTVGSFESLARLGLTPAQAVGKRFLFNGGDDSDEGGGPAEILCHGTIVEDPGFGHLAEADGYGYFWRPKAPKIV